MIYSIALEVLCCLFLLLTGVFCISWVYLRHALPWKGSRKWMPRVFSVLAIIIGAYHLIFGILKTFYTLLDFASIWS